MKRCLVFGASGAAGQSAIQAFRAVFDSQVFIYATTSKEQLIEGADETIKNCEITGSGYLDKVKSEISGPIDFFVYTPARGNLGFPVKDTSSSDLKDALDFSFEPMVKLEEVLKPGLTISYSAFYYLPHLLDFYGSMGFVKLKQEEWTLEQSERRRIIRAGSFYSQSVRGISILLQRLAKKAANPTLQNMLEKQKESGMKFDAFFLEYIAQREEEILKDHFPGIPYRMTNQADLTWALKEILSGEQSPILSVMGEWRWRDDKLPALPEFYREVR